MYPYTRLVDADLLLKLVALLTSHHLKPVFRVESPSIDTGRFAVGVPSSFASVLDSCFVQAIYEKPAPRVIEEITPTQAMDRLDAWLDKAGLMLTEEGRVLKTRNCHANMGRTPKLSLAVLLVNTTDPLVR